MGHLTSEVFQDARALFYADLQLRAFQVIPLKDAHYHRAIDLLLQHGPTSGLRTLDALQLAVALDLRQRLPFDHFVCADVSFCHIARLEGISILNPETA